MNQNVIATAALLFFIVPFVVHGIEVIFPLLSRWVVNVILPPFGFNMPNRDTSLTRDDQLTMLDAAVDAAPANKKTAAKDYIFMLLFEQRQGAIGFTAMAAGAIYGLSLSVAEQRPLHFLFGIVAVLMMLVNANQAGIPFFGNHPRVSLHGKRVGMVFAPFWALVAFLNWSAFAAG